MEKLIIATRASDLALWQAYHIKERIESSFPEVEVELNEIKDLEKQIYKKVKSSNPEIIDSINNTGKLDEETEKELTSVIEQFQKNSNK